MTQTIQKNQNYNLVPYKVDETNTIQVTQFNEDVWLTQKQMAELFDCSKMNISQHLQNIFKSGELDKNSVVKDFFTTAEDGKQYNVAHYNLDAIISVGYRVNSKRGVLFRQWATKIIKDRIKQEYEKRNSYKNTTVPQISTEKKERAKLINTLLRKKGITQKQIGKELGLSYVTISYAINGKHFSLLIENWLKENLFIEKKENDFNEKAKVIFGEALQGDYAAYNKVKKILKAIVAVNNFGA